MKTNDIEKAVVKYFNPRQNLIIANVSWGFGIHECDLLILTKADYLYEVEIKISVSDLKRDKFKRHGHYSALIRKLYFAIPTALIEYQSEIPDRAGILEVREIEREDGIKIFSVNKIREAQTFNTPKLTIEQKYQLARLGVLRLWR